jgi:hypothetical protein
MGKHEVCMSVGVNIMSMGSVGVHCTGMYGMGLPDMGMHKTGLFSNSLKKCLFASFKKYFSYYLSVNYLMSNRKCLLNKNVMTTVILYRVSTCP